MGVPDSQGTRLRWHQVMADLEQSVRNGKYLPGHKLPSLKKMAGAVGLNHLTVRRAVLALVNSSSPQGRSMSRHPQALILRAALWKRLD